MRLFNVLRFMTYTAAILTLPTSLRGLSPGNAIADDFPQQSLTFGSISTSESGDRWLCDPLKRDRKHLGFREIEEKLGLNLREREGDFIPLPGDSLSDYIYDRYGDTVMVMWSSERHRMIIEEIGYYRGGCDSWVACSLIPIDSSVPVPPRNVTYIVLRKDAFYSGPLTPYKEYQISDSSYLRTESFLRELMARTWVVYKNARHEEEKKRARPRPRAKRKAPPFPPEELARIEAEEKARKERYLIAPPEDIRINIYGVKSENRPDTLFLAASCSVGATEFAWSALFKIFKEHNTWKFETLINPWKGSFGYRFNSALDLDGNGISEYLVLSGGGARIYTLVEGKMVPLIGSNYHGC